MPQNYLVVFAQAHSDFRLPELDSVSELHGFTSTLSNHANDPSRPFMVLQLESEEHARLLARRCILIKSVTRFAYIRATTELL